MRKLLFLLLLLPFSVEAQTSVTGRVEIGLAAARPATCSAGDLFGTSDTFVLYTCGPANTWTAFANSPITVGALPTSGTWPWAGTFSGNWTSTGKQTLLAQTNCTSLGPNVKCVNAANEQGWLGPDSNAWIDAADAALGTGSGTNGIIYALGDLAAPTPLTISNSPSGATESSNTVTITTTATCSFVTGQTVDVEGVAVGGYNGSWTVLTPGCNGGSTFTYTNPTSSLGASGTGSGSFTISTTSETGVTVTVTTTGTCSFVTGQPVTISGVGVAGYNGGPFTVLSPGCNGTSTFKYNIPGAVKLASSTAGTAAAATGTVASQISLSARHTLMVTGETQICRPLLMGDGSVIDGVTPRGSPGGSQNSGGLTACGSSNWVGQQMIRGATQDGLTEMLIVRNLGLDGGFNILSTGMIDLRGMNDRTNVSAIEGIHRTTGPVIFIGNATGTACAGPSACSTSFIDINNIWDAGGSTAPAMIINADLGTSPTTGGSITEININNFESSGPTATPGIYIGATCIANGCSGNTVREIKLNNMMNQGVTVNSADYIMLDGAWQTSIDHPTCLAGTGTTPTCVHMTNNTNNVGDLVHHMFSNVGNFSVDDLNTITRTTTGGFTTLRDYEFYNSGSAQAFTASFLSAPLGFIGRTTPSDTIPTNTVMCYGDSAQPALKCSYGNDAYTTVPRITGALTPNHAITASNSFLLQDAGFPPLLSGTTNALGNTVTNLNCAMTTDAQDCFSNGETSAATGGTLTNLLANQAIVQIGTASGSTATPLEVQQAGITAATGPPVAQFETTWNNASLVGQGIVLNVTDTSSNGSSLLANLRKGNATQFSVDKVGNVIGLGTLTSGNAAGGVSGEILLNGSTSGTMNCSAPATAGTATNPMSCTNSIQLPSGTVYNWNADTGLSRDSAGVVDVGNGTAANKSGTINATTENITGTATISTAAITTQINFTNLWESKTAPTIAGAGCGGSGATISANNGTGAFSIGTGTTPTSACTVTMPSATTGWVCDANTVSATSTTNFVVKQTGAVSQTSVVLTLFSDVAGATSFTGSDTVRVKCAAY